MRIYLLALMLCLVALARPGLADYSLTILHTNDVHGRFEPVGARDGACSEKENFDRRCLGGTARLYTAIQSARRSVENSVLVDSGDQFEGSMLFREHRGQLAAEMMNTLGYDAMTLGNHEFGSGAETLRAFIDKVFFPVLAANVDVSGEPSLAGQVPRSVALPIGGQQIGFIGIVPANTSELTNIGSTLSFSAPDSAIRIEVARLSARGIDKIVLLSHAGYTEDLRLAADIAGIDVIVGGHSHTFLHNDDVKATGPYPTMVGQTAVVQAYAFGRYLGRLDVIFDDTGQILEAKGEPIELDSQVTENLFVKSRIKEAAEPLKTLRNQVIGTADAAIGEGLLGCRIAECPLGNLAAEAMLASAAQAGVEVAVTNSGSIKALIEPGEITLDDVITAFPFQDTLTTFTVTGRALKDALEAGVSKVEVSSGRFPQIAGMRFSYRPLAPKGTRITRVEIGGDALDPDREYTVVSNSFLRAGGDGYALFREADGAETVGPEFADVLADYLRANQPYMPFTDGRIEMVID
ncbi:MAG: bifunctional metallophosphatase/5'-nucleotidase [Pseudomonadota bacterium]